MNGVLALLQQPDYDLSKLLRELAKYAAIFFFIGLPILKSIVESRRKARERASQGGERGERGEARPDAQAEARRRWEELLRGEVEESAPSVPSAPAAPVRPPPISRVPEAVLPPVPSEPPARPLVVFDDAAPTAPREESLETVPDEEGTALQEIAERLREERRRRDELVRSEREAGSVRRRSAEPVNVPAFELEQIGVPDSDRSAAQRARDSRSSLRLDQRADLRRAVIANEVLGQPLALRGQNGSHSMFDLAT